MLVSADTAPLKLGHELVDRWSVFVPGDDYRVDRKVVAAERVYQAHDFKIVCDAEVLAGLALYDVPRVDADDYLRLVFHSLQELDLGVLVKAREHSHSMLILYQLAAEFQIEPAFAALYPLKDVL